MTTSARPALNPVLQHAITLICLIAAALPFVVPAIPVGTDFAKHALVANVLAHYHDPALAYDRHFDLILAPRTTMLGEFVLAALTRFANAFLAVKLYLALFILTLWLGGRFLLKQVNQPTGLAALLLPNAHSFLVFSGFLPFLGSVAVFPFLLGVRLGQRAGVRRTLLVSLLLLVLYGFHPMGLFVGLLVTGLLAIWPEQGRLPPLPAIALDLAAAIPAVVLAGYFALQKDARITQTVFGSPLGQIKAYFGYNIWPLSLRAGLVLGAGLAAFIAAVLWQAYRGKCNRALLACVVLLAAIGLVLPIQSGAAFVIGSRTLPFAMIVSLAMLRFTARGVRIAILAAAAVLVVSGALNTAAALRVQPLYREFLSGVDSVAYGSRLISIVEDRFLGGNKYIEPFGGMENAYNIYRGGSNGYALAVPFVPTGGTALRLKYSPEYTFKYSSGVTPDYHGVGTVYDYVVLFGDMPETRAVLASELDEVFRNGQLTIYRSRTRPRP